MNKLASKIAYDKKVGELNKLVQIEAKKLQDVVDQKISIERDIQGLVQRKGSLKKAIDELERWIAEKNQSLTGLIKTEQHFISNAKQELKKETVALKEAQDKLEVVKATVEGLEKTASELKGFIEKAEQARRQYILRTSALNQVDKRLYEAEEKIKAYNDQRQKDQKALDDYKTYLSDFYGKVASYVVVAKETVEYVNEALANKVPLHFQVPEGTILEINLDNFDKYEE